VRFATDADEIMLNVTRHSLGEKKYFNGETVCGVGRVFLVGCPEPVLANHCFPWYYESSSYKSFLSTGDGLLSLSGRQDDIMPYNGTKNGCRFPPATTAQTKRAVVRCFSRAFRHRHLRAGREQRQRVALVRHEWRGRTARKLARVLPWAAAAAWQQATEVYRVLPYAHSGDLLADRCDSTFASTATCIIIDHFSAFESGLVAPFLYLRDKTAGFEPKRPEI
jgi:hypothetical protein